MAGPIIIADNVTQLTWIQTPTTDAGASFPEFDWADAAGYCAGLGELAIDGFTDWRLPTQIELVSISDYGVPSPTVDPTFFPGTPLGAFWSATPVAGSVGTAYEIASGQNQEADESTQGFVRCVRGGAPPFTSSPEPAPAGRYTTAGTGAAATVYDSETLLTWQEIPAASDGGLFPAMDLASAQTYCASSTLNGATGRLPTLNELATLVDYSQPPSGAGPAMIDATLFPSTPGVFWTATSVTGTPTSGWALDFNSGVWAQDDVTQPNFVRCVR